MSKFAPFREPSVFLNSLDNSFHNNDDEELPTDAEVMDMMSNRKNLYYRRGRLRETLKRKVLMKHIKDSGIIFDYNADNDFSLNI